MANLKKRTIEVCSECGSPKVQTKEWVEVNTGAAQGSCSDGEDEDNWCPDCEQHVSFKTKKVAIVPEKKSYVILSANNEWLSTGKNATPEEIAADIVEVKEQLRQDGKEISNLFIYEIIGKPIEV